MARIALNPIIRLISGHIGGLVFRLQPDGSITLARKSQPNPNRKLSQAQAAQVQRFRLATAYSRCILEDLTTRAAYQRILAARGPLARLNALVISDTLKPPIISTLDLSAYHATGVIRVLAKDNVAVARITVTVRDQTNDQGIETLNYVPAPEQLAETVEWMFKSVTPAPIGHSAVVEVVVSDLAGNTCQMSQPV